MTSRKVIQTRKRPMESAVLDFSRDTKALKACFLLVSGVARA